MKDTKHLRRLLEKDPTDYEAIEKLIEIGNPKDLRWLLDIDNTNYEAKDRLLEVGSIEDLEWLHDLDPTDYDVRDAILDHKPKKPKKSKAKHTSIKNVKSPTLGDVSGKSNVNINYGKQEFKIDNSVKYKGQKQNVWILNITAPPLIKKFGETTLGIVGGLSLLVSIIQILIWVNTITDKKIINYVPKFSADLSNWFLYSWIILLLIGVFLLSVIAYHRHSKCQKCGKLYGYVESKDPDVEEVEGTKGIHYNIKQYYECKYCGDDKVVEYTEFEPYENDS